ncbi:hypothetical protein GH714_018850 [Hevea brasiliensis]|uniref:PUA domain-containing protein n=2 Tax=Hevea brasiliensis TaxID=3981 RepID=A0A6A6MBD8_HEVBR|nr:hypothetical protein GH714_018850 [Hevea brasiliensis]
MNPMFGIPPDEKVIQKELEKLGKALDVHEERCPNANILQGIITLWLICTIFHIPFLYYFMNSTIIGDLITSRSDALSVLGGRAFPPGLLLSRLFLPSGFRIDRVYAEERIDAIIRGTALLILPPSSQRIKMRPLDETETDAVFRKLHSFTGHNLKNIVENPSHEGPEPNPGRYCFRLHKNKVYYVSESLVKRATNISRKNLASLGTCIGKFTHGGSFHLTIQALNLLAANAKHKVWLKPTSEMSFLYGNHVLKGGLGRITDSISKNDGVVVFSMSDVPLGFGSAARSTQDCRKLDPNGIVVHHQADIGEYLRMEDEL